MNFEKRIIEELKLSKIQVNTLLKDYVSTCEKLAKEYHNEQLALTSVVHSYYQVVQETRKLGLQEVTSGLKTLEQAKKAMKENEQWFDNMYIMAKIDN